jgi:hypothetical protein
MVYARRTFSHSCLRKGNRDYAFIPGLCGLPGIVDVYATFGSAPDRRYPVCHIAMQSFLPTCHGEFLH